MVLRIQVKQLYPDKCHNEMKAAIVEIKNVNQKTIHKYLIHMLPFYRIMEIPQIDGNY